MEKKFDEYITFTTTTKDGSEVEKALRCGCSDKGRHHSG